VADLLRQVRRGVGDGGLHRQRHAVRPLAPAGRRRGRQGSAARVTEFGTGSILRPTGVAVHGQRGGAFVAELRPGTVLTATTWAAHGDALLRV
jgi:hypothetical protein